MTSLYVRKDGRGVGRGPTTRTLRGAAGSPTRTSRIGRSRTLRIAGSGVLTALAGVLITALGGRLIVEADGPQHEDRVEDAERDAWFREQGFRVLRFPNQMIENHREKVLAAIVAATRERLVGD